MPTFQSDLGPSTQRKKSRMELLMNISRSLSLPPPPSPWLWMNNHSVLFIKLKAISTNEKYTDCLIKQALLIHWYPLPLMPPLYFQQNKSLTLLDSRVSSCCSMTDFFETVNPLFLVLILCPTLLSLPRTRTLS